MTDTTQNTETQENVQTILPTMISFKMIDGAETMLHAQADFLSDMEETFVNTLRAQQDAVQKVLHLVSEARNGGTLADQVKLQLAVSEHCFTTGLALWRDTATKMSQHALKRFDASRKTVADAAEETQRAGWGVVDKAAATAKSAARRAAAEAA